MPGTPFPQRADYAGVNDDPSTHFSQDSGPYVSQQKMDQLKAGISLPALNRARERKRTV